MDLIEEPHSGGNAPEFTVSEISGAVKRVIEGEFGRVRVRGEIGTEAYNAGRFPEAIEIFRDLSTADTLQPFLTLPAYKLIV